MGLRVLPHEAILPMASTREYTGQATASEQPGQASWVLEAKVATSEKT